jgi:hypothetical protein
MTPEPEAVNSLLMQASGLSLDYPSRVDVPWQANCTRTFKRDRLSGLP